MSRLRTKNSKNGNSARKQLSVVECLESRQMMTVGLGDFGPIYEHITPGLEYKLEVTDFYQTEDDICRTEMRVTGVVTGSDQDDKIEVHGMPSDVSAIRVMDAHTNVTRFATSLDPENLIRFVYKEAENFWQNDLDVFSCFNFGQSATWHGGTFIDFNWELRGGFGDDTLEVNGSKWSTISLAEYGSIDSRDAMLYGGPGDDTLIGDEYINHLYGETGNDTLWGGAGDDTIDGGDGNDTIYGEDGSDTIHGGNHDDLIKGGKGTDKLYGDAGNDTIYGGVFSGGWAESAQGGSFADSIWGGSGHDHLYGGDGNDLIHGEAGNDKIWGGDHSDVIDGEDGVDEIHGGDGNDTLRGGNGNDFIYGDNGSDYVYGDAGDDFLYSHSQGNEAGGDGNSIDQLFGGSGNDLLQGGGNMDFLFGGDNDDNLIGGGGYDYLYGENGNDTLRWGEKMYGGLGADTFWNSFGEDFNTSQGDQKLKFWILS